jgi:hypothetical protein
VFIQAFHWFAQEETASMRFSSRKGMSALESWPHDINTMSGFIQFNLSTKTIKRSVSPGSVLQCQRALSQDSGESPFHEDESQGYQYS